jgi:hypothetical protein
VGYLKHAATVCAKRRNDNPFVAVGR